MSQKDIEKQLIHVVRDRIISILQQKAVDQYNAKNKEKVYNFDVIVENEMKARLRQEMKKAFIEFVNNENDDIDEAVREIFSDYVEEWTNNNEITFEFTRKGKKNGTKRQNS